MEGGGSTKNIRIILIRLLEKELKRDTAIGLQDVGSMNIMGNNKLDSPTCEIVPSGSEMY